MSFLVKICGLRTTHDIEAAVAAGADAIGLVLSRSPRQVRGAEVVRLFDAIPPGVERIAVLGPHPENERAMLAALPWDGVQAPVEAALEVPVPLGAFLLPVLSRAAQGRALGLAKKFGTEGNRSPAGRVPGPPGWVGVWDGRRGVASPSSSLRGSLLFDAPGGGGTGTRAEPGEALRACRAARGAGIAFVLAGGLTPENVAGAISAVRPAGVDVSSGVERRLGQKDPARIRSFIHQARAAARALPSTAELHP